VTPLSSGSRISSTDRRSGRHRYRKYGKRPNTELVVQALEPPPDVLLRPVGAHASGRPGDGTPPSTPRTEPGHAPRYVDDHVRRTPSRCASIRFDARRYGACTVERRMGPVARATIGQCSLSKSEVRPRRQLACAQPPGERARSSTLSPACHALLSRAAANRYQGGGAVSAKSTLNVPQPCSTALHHLATNPRGQMSLLDQKSEQERGRTGVGQHPERAGISSPPSTGGTGGSRSNRRHASPRTAPSSPWDSSRTRALVDALAPPPEPDIRRLALTANI